MQITWIPLFCWHIRNYTPSFNYHDKEGENQNIKAMGAKTPILSKDYTHGIHVLVYYEIFT
jgi:hypothetical protein